MLARASGDIVRLAPSVSDDALFAALGRPRFFTGVGAPEESESSCLAFCNLAISTSIAARICSMGMRPSLADPAALAVSSSLLRVGLYSCVIASSIARPSYFPPSTSGWSWLWKLVWFCADLARFGVEEVIWELREFVVSACCDENLEGWLETVRSLPRTERAAWMFQETGIHVRDILVSGDVLTWTLDYGLHLEQVSLADAKNFIREHHRHCEPPVGWKYGAAVFNGAEMIGVMTAGRPVSAELARQDCIEVNRVCVKETTPRALAENACSMLYGYACRKAFKRGHDRVVTYTLGTERGTSLRASGFLPAAKTQGGSWNRRARPRTDKSVTTPKVRWERWRDSASLPVQRCLPLAA